MKGKFICQCQMLALLVSQFDFRLLNDNRLLTFFFFFLSTFFLFSYNFFYSQFHTSLHLRFFCTSENFPSLFYQSRVFFFVFSFKSQLSERIYQIWVAFFSSPITVICPFLLAFQYGPFRSFHSRENQFPSCYVRRKVLVR